MERAQGEGALGWLASGDAHLRVFDPVVDGVANYVRQRILDRFKDCLVKLGVTPFHNHPDLAATGDSDVTDEPRELVPDGVDRLHPGLHHTGLKLAHQQIQALRRPLHAGVGQRGGACDDLIASQHEFANKAHEGVKQDDVNPQRRIAHGSAPRGPGFGLGDGLHRERFANLLGRSLPVVDQDLTERPRVAELLLEHGHCDVFGVDFVVLPEELTEQRHVRRHRRAVRRRPGRSGGSRALIRRQDSRSLGPARCTSGLHVVLGHQRR